MKANDRQVGGAHYQSGLQHWDLVEAHGVGYLEGCASKYVTRWRKKGGLQDLEKAQHYVEKLIEYAEQHGRRCRGFVPDATMATFAHENQLTIAETAIVKALFSWVTVEELRAAQTTLQGLVEGARNAASKPWGRGGQERPFGFDAAEDVVEG